MKTFHRYMADTDTPFTMYEKFVLPNGSMGIETLELILNTFKQYGRVAIFSAGEPSDVPNCLELGATLTERARKA